MSPMQTAAKNIDDYIADFPPDVQKILQKIRAAIHKAAPEAVETISYQIPTFDLNGHLIHFAAYKNHIGLYPAPSGIVKFKKELAPYESAKGSVRLPLDQPIPYDLITKIVKFRLKENLAKAEAKKKKAR